MPTLTRAARVVAKAERDDPLVHRLIEGILTEPALALGFNAANRNEHVMAFFDKMEGLLGPVITGMAITTMGELVQVKGKFKEKVTSMGVPAPLIAGFNGLLDEGFEGVWAARAARGAKKGDPVTDADVKAGMGLAKKKFAEAQRLERIKFMTALTKVDPAKRAEFLRKAATFTSPEDQKKFAHYRPLLVEEVWMVEHLSGLPTAEWFSALEAVFGPYMDMSAKTVAKNVLHAIEDTAKAVVTQLEGVFKAPAAGQPNPVGDALSDLKKRARRWGI